MLQKRSEPRDAAPPRGQIAVVAAAILVATTAITWPGLDGELTNWDDDRYVTDNPHVDGLTRENLVHAFSGFHFQSYHPLHLVSYMVDGELWPGNATLYHVHNLVLFLAGVGLLFLLLIRLGVGLAPAAAGALLFAVAPYRVESVIWITSRKDVLSLALSLFAWHLHLGSGVATGKRRVALASLATATLAAALTAKSAAVVVPPMMVVADVALMGVPVRRALLRSTPYLVLAAAISVLVPILWQEAEMTRAPLSEGLAGRLALVGWTVSHYLGTAIWPYSLTPLYAEPVTPLEPAAVFLGPLALLAAGATLLLADRFGRDVRLPTVALAWFVIGIAPFLNIIPLYYLVADRYLLFASFGVAAAGAALTGAIAHLDRRDRRLLGLTGVALVILAWSVASAAEARHWRSSERLWRHAVAAEPDSFFARLKLGQTLVDGGKPAEAADQYREARRIRPGSPSALVGVFSAELAADGERAGLDPARAEELVARFTSLVNDGPALLALARELERQRMPRAAQVARARVLKPIK